MFEKHSVYRPQTFQQPFNLLHTWSVNSLEWLIEVIPSFDLSALAVGLVPLRLCVAMNGRAMLQDPCEFTVLKSMTPTASFGPTMTFRFPIFIAASNAVYRWHVFTSS